MSTRSKRVRPHAKPGESVAFIKVAGRHGWAKVDACDLARVSKIKWHTDRVGVIKGYSRKSDGGDGRKHCLHVLVLGRRKGLVVDHLDGDHRNCTRANLRHVRQAVNVRNRTGDSNSRSGIRGVHAFGDKWVVAFCLRHQRLSLGVYSDLAEARLVANTALGLIFGRITRLLDGRPFDESHIDQLVSQAAGIGPKGMRRLLATTWNLGDALSAKLRRRLNKAYPPMA